jgi:hypothetical protein
MASIGISLQRRLLRAGLIAALLLRLATVAAADAPTVPERDAFLEQLAGDWALTGHVRDKPVRYRGRAAWVLEDGWLRFSLVDAAAPPGYAAHLYLSFDAKAGDYVAHWLDRFGAAGARVVGLGHRIGQTLVLVFPYAESTFRDTLTLAADGASGSLLLESRNAAGEWSTFAAYAMKRRR